MILLYLFTICLIRYSTAVELTDLDVRLRSSVASISESFNKLIEDIKIFFQCKYEALLHRRTITKNAFNKFILESVNKSATKKCDEDKKRIENTQNKETNNERSQETRKFIFKPTLLKKSLDMDMSKLITSHGYRFESHTTITADGYILTLHRILLRDSVGRGVKKVLLHHGLLGSSEDWMLLGSNKALPYLLWLSGYDVWLTNARGNKFSKSHTRFPVNSKEFWDFSFHEIGIYDLPAAINYIKEISDSNEDLHYIGYSMGATALLVLLSTHPQYNYILKSATLLAPLAFMYNVKGPMRYFAKIDEYGNIDDLGNKNFLVNSSIPSQIFNKFCVDDHRLCLKSILLLANGGRRILNEDLRRDILYYASEEGSAKTIKHFAQLVNSGQFQMYDYGLNKNLKKYGTKTPPSYRLNDVTLPVALITSVDDWLCSLSDITSLIPFLSNPIAHHVVKRYKFSHTDFLWAEDSPELVYSVILDILSDPEVTKYRDENIFSNNLVVTKK